MKPVHIFALLAGLATAGAFTACGSSPPEQPAPFSLQFAATVDGKKVGCTDALTGFGPDGKSQVGINDLRFYVSNLQFLDSSGKPVTLTLDTNEFQYQQPDGTVTLVDLTGNTEGTCTPTSIDFAEGTARVHPAITGTTLVNTVASVAFDLGLPQGLMKSVIASKTPEGAPSPLAEMYWNWNSGYRHFVLNLAVKDGSGKKGSGYVHVGSIGCAPADGSKALSDRASCTFVNTPAAALSSFDLKDDTVGIDLRKLLGGLDFIAPVYDPKTFMVIGSGPGVSCHSSPMQPHCPTLFSHLGVDITTGKASAASDSAVVRLPGR